MDLKNEKGITLIALLLTVIVMVILIGVGMHFGREAIDKATLEDIKTDMISIKTRAKIIVEQYNFKDIEELVGSEITASQIEELGLSEEESENILKWSSEDLESQNLTSIDGDKYVVYYNLENPNNCEVYYLEGYEIGENQKKYSLTELQEL